MVFCLAIAAGRLQRIPAHPLLGCTVIQYVAVKNLSYSLRPKKLATITKFPVPKNLQQLCRNLRHIWTSIVNITSVASGKNENMQQ